MTEEKWNAYTFKTKVPEGTMFVIFCENVQTGKLEQILIHIGKAGSGLSAWADSTARLVNMQLKSGTDIFDVALELSDMRSDKFAMDGHNHVRSGPEGLSYTIQKYLRVKKNMNKAKHSRPGLIWDEMGARN